MATESAALLFKITADGKQAQAELKAVQAAIRALKAPGELTAAQKELEDLLKGGTAHAGAFQAGLKGAASEASNLVGIFTGNRLTGATSQLTSFANAAGAIPGPVGLAVGAVAGLITAAVGVGAALFEITKKTAEYGGAIFEMTEKTGLSAKTISALKVEGDKLGVGLDEINRGIRIFTLTMGDAASGSEKAQAKLAALHVTSTNLDEGFAQVIKRISELKPGIEQNAAAADAFGKRFGQQLIPLINEFHGDLPGLIDELDRMGLTMNDKDAREAHEFELTMKQLEIQFAAVARTLGRELMPTFLKAANDISSWLRNNQGTVAWWAGAITAALKGVIYQWQLYAWAVRSAYEILKHPSTPVLEPPPTAPGVTNQRTATEAGGQPGLGDYTSGRNTGGGGAAGAAAEKKFKLSPTAQAVVDAANKLGLSPLDLASILYYEGAGSLDTSVVSSPKTGPRAGQKFVGPLQMGPSEQKAYGTYAGQEFSKYMDGVVRYFEDRFKKAGRETPGASIIDMYRTVLTGTPTGSLTATDANRTSVLSALPHILGASRDKALAQLFGGKTSNVPSDQAGNELAKLQKQLAEEAKKQQEEMLAAEKEGLDKEVELYASAKELEKSIIDQTTNSEVEAIQKKQAVDEDVFNFRLQQLEKLREAAQDDAKINAEIDQKEALLFDQIAQSKIKAENEVIEAEKREGAAIVDKITKLNKEKEAQDELNHARSVGLLESIFNEQELQKELQAQRDADTPFAMWTASWQEFVDSVTSQVGTVQASLGTLAGMLQDQFFQLAQGIGRLVEQYVLLGTTGPAAFRKLLAAALASIAAEAAVRAIQATALGFLKLAMWDFSGAANAFISAGLWAAIAGVTALAGRAVAGNSFKQQTAAATGGRGSSAGGSSTGNQSPPAYTRGGSEWGSWRGQHDAYLADAINRFSNKFDSVSPGHVLMAGMQERPGAVGNQAVKDVNSNALIGTNFLKAAGVRS